MNVQALSPRILKFIGALPDGAGARIFIERLFEEHPQIALKYSRNEEICVKILTLAAYSPLLAETMLQRPEYIAWLDRERALTHIKSKEELVEELARFASVNSTLEESVRLSRFKRRELLRIYLRDCMKLATLSETTAELSNLADAILERALRHCYQPLVARYGQPQTTDMRGRLASAEMAVMALGKLGSGELNYSSDIDLIFIYSADGNTSSMRAGSTETLTNKFFFTKLAEAVVKTISSPFGEGVVFRVDLRLRPRGREGDLVVSLAEALRYYREEAQSWERQALVRARAAAGDAGIVEKFLAESSNMIFRPKPLVEALREVRLSKEKIDKDAAKRSGGYNLKLGRGGIREIEFIVQALQICYGGSDAWLRAPQISIGLQRLSDKNLISDAERTRLAHAYAFLRLAEHRLQMEHGLQTHSLPLAPEKLDALARRCGFNNAAAFEEELEMHRRNVGEIYNRVFGETEKLGSSRMSAPSVTPMGFAPETPIPIGALGADSGALEKLFHDAVAALAVLKAVKLSKSEIVDAAAAGLQSPINRARALRRLRDFALSMATDEESAADNLNADQIRELTIIGGSSQYFIQLLISHPRLARLLGGPAEFDPAKTTPESMRQAFISAVGNTASVNEEFDETATRLRKCRHEQLLAVGRWDLLGKRDGAPMDEEAAISHLRQINFAQTALAEAALGVACDLACRKVSERFERTGALLVYSILGLGRLGHRAIDYDSDLDVIFVYSDEAGSAAHGITNQEFYACVMETIVQMLSTLTRHGAMYRVDLRLRPDGRSGLLAINSENLLQYLSERAAVWELAAYLKMRPTAGDFEFGRRVESRALETIFERGRANPEKLAEEVAKIRTRLEKEKVGARTDDFKFGAGGLLDIHFATRYLQLRYAVPDTPERGTFALIDKLEAMGLLMRDQAETFKSGHSFLRRLDHQVRLQLERPQSILPKNPAQRLDLARGLGFDDEAALLEEYNRRVSAIRNAYQQIIYS